MRIFWLRCLMVTTAVAVCSCGGSSDSTNEIADTLGDLSCDEPSYSGSYSFTDDTYAGVVTRYSGENCTGAVLEKSPFAASYSLGRDVTTASGITATEIDFVFEIDSKEYPVKGLIYRDGKKLYFGQETEDDVRPADIDFDYHLTLREVNSTAN